MAGYKRPYPAEWERGYPDWGGPSRDDHMGAYYSGLQWGEPVRDYAYDYARAWRPPPYDAPERRPEWNDPYGPPRPDYLYPEPYGMSRREPGYRYDPPYRSPNPEAGYGNNQSYGNNGPNQQGLGNRGPDQEGNEKEQQANKTGKPETVDFTDDYAVFYDNPSGNWGSGRGQGKWGQFRGQGRGQYNNGESENQNQYYGNNETSGTPQDPESEFSQSPSKKPYQAPNRGSSQGPHQDSNRGFNQGRGGQNKRGVSPHGRGSAQRGLRGNRGNARGRGLPPSNFGGRGRGYGKGSNVPPIHSLAKGKPSFPDFRKMSSAEKIHRFCLYLRNLDVAKLVDRNPIQLVVNGLSLIKLGLKLDFEAEEYSSSVNCHTYTGSLKLDEIFICRCVGLSKKEVRASVFGKAVDVLKTHTVAEIFGLEDLGTEGLHEELIDKCKLTKPTLVSQKQSKDETAVKLDLRSALESLIKQIKIMGPITDNVVCYMSRALAHLQGTTDFEFCFTSVGRDIMYFIGTFVFCGIVIGRGYGTNKRLCKRQVFQMMYDRLTTLTIDELIQPLPEDTADIKELSDSSLLKNRPKPPLKERLETLMNTLIDMTMPTHIVHPVDSAAINLLLYPMLIHKPVNLQGTDQDVICEFYLENIYIASGASSSKKESIYKAYCAALDVLTSTDVDVICKEHRRITDEEMRSNQIMEVNVKGTGKSIETNLAGLRRFGHDPTKLDKELKDLVILEHSDWAMKRVKHAFTILHFSCAKNGLFMICETDIELETGGVYKGTVTVKGKLVGESYGFGKNYSRNLACTDALFRLYETQDVIRIKGVEDDENLIPYEDIKKAADSLRAENEDTDEEQMTDEKGHPVADRYICQAIDKKLDEYVNKPKEIGNELVLGPGFTESEWRYLRLRAKDYNLKSDIKQNKSDTYYMIYQEYDWRSLADLLKTKDNRRIGRYELMTDEEKPKYSMVEETILKEPPVEELKSGRRKKKKKAAPGSDEVVKVEISE